MRKINPDEIPVVEDEKLAVDFSTNQVYGSFGDFLYNLKKLSLCFVAFFFFIFLSYPLVYSKAIEDGKYFYHPIVLLYSGAHIGMLIVFLSNIIVSLPDINLIFLVVFYFIFVLGVVYEVFYMTHSKYSKIIVFNENKITELSQRLDGGEYEVVSKSDISDIVIKENGIEVKTEDKNYTFDKKFLDDIYMGIHNIS